MKLEDAIKKYLEYLIKELNYSTYTKDDYAADLYFYAQYVKDHHLNYLDIQKDDIMGFLKYLDKIKYSNKTISRHLSKS